MKPDSASDQEHKPEPSENLRQSHFKETRILLGVEKVEDETKQLSVPDLQLELEPLAIEQLADIEETPILQDVSKIEDTT